MARKYGETSGHVPPALDQQELAIAEKVRQQSDLIMSSVRERGLILIFTPVTSSSVLDGERINFTLFMCFCGSIAPMLLAAANELGCMFTLDVELSGRNQAIVAVKGAGDLRIPDTFVSAVFTITGKSVHAVDLATGGQRVLKGNWLGGAHSVEGGIEITAGAEQPIELISIVHEVVHAKWPNEVPQQDHHIDGIAETIISNIKESWGAELEIAREVEQERIEALAKFNELDEELSRIIAFEPS